MRRARITTTHDEETVAARVAAAVAPDNTDEVATRADGPRVVTTVERETTGGLRSTVDDYVVNLTVARRLSGDSTDTTTDRAAADAAAAADDTDSATDHSDAVTDDPTAATDDTTDTNT